MTDIPTPEDDYLRAAELALGLLDPVEQKAAIARAVTDPSFAASHDFWLARALSLCAVQAVEPDPLLWDRIVAALPQSNAPTTSEVRKARAGWLQAAAIAAAFVAGWAGGHWTVRPPLPRAIATASTKPASPTRPLLAVLTSSEGRAVLAVSFTPDETRLASVPKSVKPGRKVPELWVIPANGKPHSLGVLSSERPSWRDVNATARPYLQAGATLAVSLEPTGGSNTGLPTGPVILTGILSEPS